LCRSSKLEQDYSRGVYELCRKYNVLFIADEIRQGAGKTGKFLSFQHIGDDFKPDIVTMGKSMTGGFYPQSFVMGTDQVMHDIGPFEIASTYGFTPLGIAAASAAIEVIDREHMMEKAVHIEKLWTSIVESWDHPLVDYVAAIGADSNLVLKENVGRRLAALCMHRGLFVVDRPFGLRISFAMNIPEELLTKGAGILKSCLDDIDKYGHIEGENQI
jgi:ornithine--oxo-acid transaminase